MDLKTEPFAHQRDVYLAHRDRTSYALLWEMGLGKSKLLLDVASWLHHQGKIQCMVVVAPNEVYTNWLTQELPQHLTAEYIGMAFPKNDTRRAMMKRLVFLDPSFESSKLRFMCISFDSVRTARGMEYLTKLLTIYETMLVCDESTAIKTHKAQISKKMKKLGKLAAFRWIATGTPVANGPFDIHSQIEFLDPDFWGEFGLKTFTAFKNEFGIYTQRTIQGRQFNELKAYRRLDTLTKIIAPISSRLLKEDSEVKLPPKLYTTRTFELTHGQREVYETLRKEFRAELEGGLYLEAALAIVRLTKLQQIACGFVRAEELTEEEMDIENSDPIKILKSETHTKDLIAPEDNPRLRLLEELINEANHKVIVWCRFTRDVDLITAMLSEKCVRFDGSVSQTDREIALTRFRDKDDPVKVFVGNTHAVSRGITLTIAKTVVYYSNSFSLERRLQSEDRNHRIGQDVSVHIIDIAAEQTVDERIIQNLRSKFNIAAQVTGDKFREWI